MYKRQNLPGSRNFVKALREKAPWVTSVVQNCNPRRTSSVLGSDEMCIRDSQQSIGSVYCQRAGHPVCADRFHGGLPCAGPCLAAADVYKRQAVSFGPVAVPAVQLGRCRGGAGSADDALPGAGVYDLYLH